MSDGRETEKGPLLALWVVGLETAVSRGSEAIYDYFRHEILGVGFGFDARNLALREVRVFGAVHREKRHEFHYALLDHPGDSD